MFELLPLDFMSFKLAGGVSLGSALMIVSKDGAFAEETTVECGERECSFITRMLIRRPRIFTAASAPPFATDADPLAATI